MQDYLALTVRVNLCFFCLPLVSEVQCVQELGQMLVVTSILLLALLIFVLFHLLLVFLFAEAWAVNEIWMLADVSVQT